ncbi:MAG: SufD family Fe-S cluster assembly protein, partial [Bacilli bacterium]|nr:SufD family Fe-S cluster assembly protein [Bacilli bacterium]
MNKLFTKGEVKKINNEIIKLSSKINNIEINGESKILILNKSINNLNVLIKKNSQVIIEDFRIIEKEKTLIKIYMEKNSEIIYNHSFINNKNYDLNILTKYLGDDSKIIFNVHGINDRGACNIIADGVLGKNKYNELLENIRIINLNNGKAITIPNILVNNNEVLANHAATIGKINKDEL